MNGRACQACGRPLEGRQLKFCADEVCSTERKRWAWILKTYNLTKEQYEAILEHQGNVCGLCKEPFKESQTPHIDHDHKTGYVRGIVHAYCNTRLLHRLRFWETAQKVADYLRWPPAVAALGGPVVAPGRPKKTRKRRKR